MKKRVSIYRILWYLSLLVVFIGLVLPYTIYTKYLMMCGGMLFTLSLYKRITNLRI